MPVVDGKDDARNPYEVACDRAEFFGIFFAIKIGKLGQKYSFLNLLKILVINFHLICSITKIYIICCIPAQIPILLL